MERIVLASIAGEVVLKSERTRPRFESRLVANVRDALERNGVSYRKVWIEDARLFIDTDEPEKAIDVLTRVFGVHGATLAYYSKYESLDDIAAFAEKVASEWVVGKKFAVRAKRAFAEGFTSLDVAKVVGARLKPYSAGVDLENPDVEVHVEVRGKKVYVYKEFAKGPGGLPVGVEGRALVLFSGGFDSPVASWLIAKRGVEVDFLHYILANPRSAEEALEVAKVLASKWLYGYKPRFIVVDFRPIVAGIAVFVRRDYAQVVLRASMYLVAAKLAKERGYDAIVTGESIGQVSTQTLANLTALNEVVGPRIPLVLRPLIGLDKEEIMQIARRIGTYEASARVKEYCHIARGGPSTTRADIETLREELKKLEDTGVLERIKIVEEKILV